MIKSSASKPVSELAGERDVRSILSEEEVHMTCKATLTTTRDDKQPEKC